MIASPISQSDLRLCASRAGLELICLVVLSLSFVSSVLAHPPATSADTFDKDHPEKFARGLELFKKSVRQTLVQHCLKCHGGQKVEAEFNLASRELILKGGTSGKVVEPGKAAASRLVQRLKHAEKPGMPFNGE